MLHKKRNSKQARAGLVKFCAVKFWFSAPIATFGARNSTNDVYACQISPGYTYRLRTQATSSLTVLRIWLHGDCRGDRALPAADARPC